MKNMFVVVLRTWKCIFSVPQNGTFVERKMVRKLLALLFIVAPMFILSSCITAGEGIGNYKTSLQSKRITSIDATQGPVRFGKIAIRFEVRDGQCSHGKGDWSDCANDRERSELKGPIYSGGPHWYAYSIYIPENHPNIWPTTTTLGQFYQSKKGPVFMFQRRSPHGYGGLWVNHIDAGGPANIIDEPDFKGKWHDIVIKAIWTNGKHGEFVVWVNGVEKYSYNGPTTEGGGTYFKFGIYRSFMSRYKYRTGENTVPTQIIYYDEVRHGRTRADVDIRMIEISD